MFDWLIPGAGALFVLVGGAVGDAVGWAWDKVTSGIYTWLANGLALLMEWVWSVLDAGSTPRLTADWFANDLAVQLGLLGLSVTVAMMLASATQAALVGRPEQIVDAVRQGIGAIVASALTVTVIDVLLRIVDDASAAVWESGRDDLVTMFERITLVATTSGPVGSTFIGPLCLLLGFVGLLGLVVSLMMRAALIYLAAALSPVVWSANVLPLFRGSARKLIHLTVALIVSKLAIVVALVVAVRLIGNAGGDPESGSIVNDGAAAVGTLVAGFTCFLIAAVTPLVLYKLMPTVEGAIVGTGVAGGWGRSATAAAHTALMVKSMGATKAASAATKPIGGRPPRGGIAGLTGVATDNGQGEQRVGDAAARPTDVASRPTRTADQPRGKSRVGSWGRRRRGER